MKKMEEKNSPIVNIFDKTLVSKASMGIKTETLKAMKTIPNEEGFKSYRLTYTEP